MALELLHHLLLVIWCVAVRLKMVANGVFGIFELPYNVIFNIFTAEIKLWTSTVKHLCTAFVKIVK